jgi:hypothetical protein
LKKIAPNAAKQIFWSKAGHTFSVKKEVQKFGLLMYIAFLGFPE